MIKISIYDLDGTVWNVNSHIDIVDKFLGKKVFGSILGKIIAFFCPNLFMKALQAIYIRIPKDYFEEYNPNFRQSVIEEMEREASEGFHVIIISNAPIEILRTVEKRLSIKTYHAPIGKKRKLLQENYDSWDYLRVSTDNLSDNDLIEIADEVIIFTNKLRKEKFAQLPCKGTKKYIDSKTR